MTTRYADCVYSTFISYAHADDPANFSWVTYFRNELQKKLQGDLARAPGGGKPSHLSQENGPIRGGLSSELRNRIQQSFALIVVAGDNYLGSEWCVEELEFFKSHFGADGMQRRLYILALRNDVGARVQLNPAWQRLALPDQVWVPCYNEQNKAIRPYIDTGALTARFQDLVGTLADDLVRSIRESLDAKMPPAVKGTELLCDNANVARNAPIVREQPVDAAAAPVADRAPEPSSPVQIYIESNPLELDEWKPLGRRIAQLWKDVNTEAQNDHPLRMRVRGLPVDEIDPRHNQLSDADGVVLLWGQKDSHALRKNIDKIEELLPPTDVIAPGLVACLRPPQKPGKPAEALGWSVVGFDNCEPVMQEDPSETRKLRSFLKDILEKRTAA
ncbi:MAG: toll/interleukin-1 receptor domain-containing protein [Proteobacteria bacterium]|nr:toll/interleukin-1 receptor domain-containing protein [Burkholderiales bacterium]